MTTVPTKPASNDNGALALSASRVVPIFTALLLGTFIVGGVGFANIAAVHNAAHDYRHSMAFPCH